MLPFSTFKDSYMYAYSFSHAETARVNDHKAGIKLKITFITNQLKRILVLVLAMRIPFDIFT